MKIPSREEFQVAEAKRLADEAAAHEKYVAEERQHQEEKDKRTYGLVLAHVVHTLNKGERIFNTSYINPTVIKMINETLLPQKWRLVMTDTCVETYEDCFESRYRIDAL